MLSVVSFACSQTSDHTGRVSFLSAVQERQSVISPSVYLSGEYLCIFLVLSLFMCIKKSFPVCHHTWETHYTENTTCRTTLSTLVFPVKESIYQMKDAFSFLLPLTTVCLIHFRPPLLRRPIVMTWPSFNFLLFCAPHLHLHHLLVFVLRSVCLRSNVVNCLCLNYRHCIVLYSKEENITQIHLPSALIVPSNNSSGKCKSISAAAAV